MTVLRNPQVLRALEAMGRLAGAVIRDPTVLVDVVGQTIQRTVTGIQEAQNQNNPIDRPANYSLEDLANPYDGPYSRFARGWYGGYIAGKLAFEYVFESITGGIGNALVRNIGPLESLARRAGNVRSAVAAATVGRIADGAVAGARRLKRVGLNTRPVQRGLEGVSATRQALVERAFRRFDDDRLSDLSDTEQEELVEFVSERGLRNADQIRRLDDDQLKEFASQLACRAGASGASSLAVPAGAPPTAGTARLERPAAAGTGSALGASRPGDCDGLSDDAYWYALKGATRGGDDFASLVRKANDPDIDSDWLDEIASQSLNGAAFVSRTDDDALEALYRLSDEGEVPRSRIENFADETGRRGSAVVNGLDDHSRNDALEKFFDFESSTDEVDAELADEVRENLAHGHWWNGGGDRDGLITIDGIVDSTEDVIQLGRSDDVTGVDEALQGFVDQPLETTPSNWGSARGSLYELRVAHRDILDDDELNGNTLRLGAEPFEDFDTEDIEALYNEEGEYSEDVVEICKQLIDEHPEFDECNANEEELWRDENKESLEGRIRDYLDDITGTGGTPEFDGFVIQRSDRSVVYYEFKSGEVNWRDDIEKKRTYLEAYRYLSQRESSAAPIDNVRMYLYHRLPRDSEIVTSRAINYLIARNDGGRDKSPWTEVD